jgi:hypothetical protein
MKNEQPSERTEAVPQLGLRERLMLSGLLLLLAACTAQPAVEAISQQALLTYTCDYLSHVCQFSAADLNNAALAGITFTSSDGGTGTTGPDGHVSFGVTPGSTIGIAGDWSCRTILKKQTYQVDTEEVLSITNTLLCSR